MKKLNFLLKFILGILVLLLLIYKVGFSDISLKIISINPLILLTVFIIIFITLFIGALNLNILISPLMKVPFSKVFQYSMISWALGLFIPGKMGEFLIIPLLKKEGISIGKGTAITIIDKLITILTLSLFSIIGFLLFLENKTIFKLTISILLLILIPLFFIFSKNGREIIKKYILREYSSKFEGFYKVFSYYIKKQKSILILNLIITSFKWFLSSIITYLLFIYYGYHLPIIYIFLITSMLVMITLIPLTISGLGIRESSAVLLFSLFGIKSSITISVYIIQLIVTYILGTTILLFFLKEIKIKSNDISSL